MSISVIKTNMFCKVCKDSGKSNNEFTNHCTKDSSGKVCCPTLLGQNCRYCLQKGHTIKYCKELVEYNKSKNIKTKMNERKRQVQVLQVDAVVAKRKELLKPVLITGNIFTIFNYDDSDSESDIENEIDIDRNNGGCLYINRDDEDSCDNYSNSDNELIYVNKMNDLKSLSHHVTLRIHPQHYVKNETKINPIKIKKNWADLSDSDDDSY